MNLRLLRHPRGQALRLACRVAALAQGRPLARSAARPLLWLTGCCVVLAVVLALGGCPKPLVLRPYAPPKAAELLAEVRHSHDAVLAMRARAKADFLDGAAGRAKIDIGLVLAKPDKLRLAGENSLTGPLLTLTTDGEVFQLLDVRRNSFMAGKINPCNMARLIRVALHPREAVEVLVGSAPLFPESQITSADVQWSGKDGGREVLSLHDSLGRTLVLSLAPVLGGPEPQRRGFDVMQAEGRDAAGQVVWRVRHEGFSDVPLVSEGSAEPAKGARTVRLPAVTYIEDPPHKSDVRLRWRERELNPNLEPGLFHLDAPPGVPSEPDLCAGAGETAPLPPGPAVPAAAPEPATPGS